MNKLIRINKVLLVLLIFYVSSILFFYRTDYFRINFLPVSVYLFYPRGNDREMLRAVINGDIDMIEKYSNEHNVDVNKLSRNDNLSFLHFAFLTKQKDSFEKLLELGAIPDKTTGMRHVFTLSTYDHDPYYFDILFDYPKNFINYVESISGQYIYPKAITRAESIRRFKLLFEKGADPNRIRPGNPLSLISTALYRCDYDRVLILLNHGVLFDDLSVRKLIEPNPENYRKRVCSVSREDIVYFLNKHYSIDVKLQVVIDNNGDIIE